MYGSSTKVVSPVDSILLTSHHALRNNFAPFATIKDLCDLIAWWSVQGTRWKLKDAVDRAKRTGLCVPCLALWNILVCFDAGSPAQKGVEQIVAEVSEQERHDAYRLMDSFVLQQSDRALNPDFLRVLLSPSTVRHHMSNHVRSVIYGSHDLKLHGEHSEAIRLGQMLAEIFRIDSRRLSSYLALARSENRYVGAPRSDTEGRERRMLS